MAVKKELEVLPAENKELKLGWVVSETIGVAIVNPRGVNGMKAIPKFVFGDENGYIEIRRYSIQIVGSLEAAAKAMVEKELLPRRDATSPSPASWDYMKVIEVTRTGTTFKIDLTDDGLGLIDPEIWATFKKSVEKMSNDLTAFL